MKKIKDPALFERIKKFLTEYMPVVRKKSSNTVSAYCGTLNIYLEFLQKVHTKSLGDITSKYFNQKNILSFMEWLVDERGNKVSTANLRLKHMKRFCRFLMEENTLMLSELSAIREVTEIPETKTDTITFLTAKETRLILSQPDTDRKTGIRDRFFMSLLYDSGCRIQEMMDLKLKDFILQKSGAELHVIGKGNKYRVTPISAEIWPFFEEYCQHYHNDRNYDKYMFYTIRNGVVSRMSCDNAQAFLKKYGTMARKTASSIPHIHPHLLRHTRAMHLYLAGMPLELVSQWLGHSQMETTLIYQEPPQKRNEKPLKESHPKRTLCLGKMRTSNMLITMR